jgi:hypothetical protein
MHGSGRRIDKNGGIEPFRPAVGIQQVRIDFQKADLYNTVSGYREPGSFQVKKNQWTVKLQHVWFGWFNG